MVDSFSYRFDTPDRTIVISGDTAPTQALLDHSRGCDVLIHDAYSIFETRNTVRPGLEFRRRHHTSSVELAAIANAVNPKLLITYHRSHTEKSPAGPQDVLVEEIRRTYRGEVIAARDLDVF
jgi:ribonuclease BN (tRNA processing enzyme)